MMDVLSSQFNRAFYHCGDGHRQSLTFHTCLVSFSRFPKKKNMSIYSEQRGGPGDGGCRTLLLPGSSLVSACF